MLQLSHNVLNKVVSILKARVCWHYQNILVFLQLSDNALIKGAIGILTSQDNFRPSGPTCEWYLFIYLMTFKNRGPTCSGHQSNVRLSRFDKIIQEQ